MAAAATRCADGVPKAVAERNAREAGGEGTGFVCRHFHDVPPLDVRNDGDAFARDEEHAADR